jgi:hypothetical protein
MQSSTSANFLKLNIMDYLAISLSFLYFAFSERKDLSRYILQFSNSKFGKSVHKVVVNLVSFTILLAAFILSSSLWIIKFNGSLTGFYCGLAVFSFLAIYSMYFRNSTLDL